MVETLGPESDWILDSELLFAGMLGEVLCSLGRACDERCSTRTPIALTCGNDFCTGIDITGTRTTASGQLIRPKLTSSGERDELEEKTSRIMHRATEKSS